MKKLHQLLLFLFLGLCHQVSAQTLFKSVLASGGQQYSSSAGNSVVYTVGEAVILDFNAQGINLLQGFNGAPSLRVITATSKPDSEPGFKVYPNPNNGLFYLYGASGAISVYSNTGKLLISQFVNAKDEPVYLDWSELPTGTYLIRLLANNHQTTTRLVKF
jgi:hypothetical protein